MYHQRPKRSWNETWKLERTRSIDTGPAKAITVGINLEILDAMDRYYNPQGELIPNPFLREMRATAVRFISTLTDKQLEAVEIFLRGEIFQGAQYHCFYNAMDILRGDSAKYRLNKKHNTKGRRYTGEIRQLLINEVARLRSEGLSIAKIANELSISAGTISELLIASRRANA